jgi:hypothetical protein
MGESPDFDGLIGAAKGAPPSPRLRLGVHVRDENISAWSHHPCQFARQNPRVKDMTDSKRANNNIRHSGTKRKCKAICQDEAVSKKSLLGGAADHLGAGIYPHHGSGAAVKERTEPTARPAANIEGVLAP